MNADRLLAHYAEIGEAPNAAATLRRFVLELAVRGKLVPQDKREGTPRHGSAPNGASVPYPLPTNWRWMAIGDQLDLLNGMAFKPADWIASGLRIVRIQNLNNPAAPFNFCAPEMARERSLIDTGAFLISWSGTPGTSFGAFIWDRGPAVLNQHIFRCDFKTDAFDPKYLRIAINGRLDEMIAKAHGGVGLQHITKGKLEALLIALPPLAEQHRIVAKVDELMGLCDELEAARTAREAARDRLAAANLARLNAPNPETLQADARFTLESLPAVTARADQMKQLRQTVLNLGVLGKLVPQNGGEEPASTLLAKIASAKERLVTTGEARPERGPRRASSHVRADIPRGWAWTTLQSVCLSITDGDHQPPPKADAGVPFLVIGDVRSGAVNYDAGRWVPRSYYDNLDATRRPRGGDLLYTLVGSFGIPVRVLDDREFCVQRHIGILRPSPEISAQFLARVLESRVVFDQADACATGIAQKTVPLWGLRAISIPVPPRSEQDRIVAKIDQLIALCDDLEASLDSADATRKRLLEALLAEALAPDARDLRAA